MTPAEPAPCWRTMEPPQPGTSPLLRRFRGYWAPWPSRKLARAVSATSTPRTGSPSEATCSAFSPLPQPASSTAPANLPAAARRTTRNSECMTPPAVSCTLPTRHGCRPPNRSGGRTALGCGRRPRGANGEEPAPARRPPMVELTIPPLGFSSLPFTQASGAAGLPRDRSGLRGCAVGERFGPSSAPCASAT